jgi:hypothetical protein
MIKTCSVRFQCHFAWIVIAKLIGVAAHYPVVAPKLADNFLVGQSAEPMIGFVGYGKVAFVEIDHSVRVGADHPGCIVALGTVQANYGVVKSQLVAQPLFQNGFVVFSD